MADQGLRALLRAAGPAPRWLAFGAGVTVVSGAITVAQPLVVREILLGVERGSGLDAGAVSLLVLLFTAEAVLWSAELYLFGRGGHGTLRALRVKLVNRLLRLRVAFHDRTASDDLISRLGTDTSLFGTALAQAAYALASGGVIMVGSLVVMALLDPLLLGVSMVSLTAALFLLFKLAPRVQDASESAQDAVGEMAQAVGRPVRALRTVKAARAEGHLAAVGIDRVQDAYEQGLRVTRLDALITPGTSMAIQGAFIVILTLGGARVASGVLTVADFVAFVLYLFAITDPLYQVFDAIVELNKGLGAGRRIGDALRFPVETELEVQRGGRAGEERASPGERRVADRDSSITAEGPEPSAVRLDAVTFSYRPGRLVLDQVSFSVLAGSQTAIVGPSGAGKTTVLSLLERFYEPNSGVLYVDERDIAELSLPDLRRRVALVEQSAPVLDGSIRDNMVLGRPGADAETVQSVARLTGVLDMAQSLPDEMSTRVGEAGATLSGGQRQRLALARGLVQEPAVLLLDEPTSQLDAISEDAVRRALAAYRGRMTIIVVAHRLATVQAADSIIVLEDGRVRAQGRHRDLLEGDGLYRELAHHQLIDR